MHNRSVASRSPKGEGFADPKIGTLNHVDLEKVDAMARCRLGAPGKRPDFILFGDSFAAAIADGVNVAALRHNRAGLLMALSACPPIVGIDGTSPDRSTCRSFQQSMLSDIDKLGVKTVILTASWGELDNESLIKNWDANASDGADAFQRPMIATLSEMK